MVAGVGGYPLASSLPPLCAKPLLASWPGSWWSHGGVPWGCTRGGRGTPRPRPWFPLCLPGLQPRARGQLCGGKLTVWRSLASHNASNPAREPVSAKPPYRSGGAEITAKLRAGSPVSHQLWVLRGGGWFQLGPSCPGLQPPGWVGGASCGELVSASLSTAPGGQRVPAPALAAPPGPCGIFTWILDLALGLGPPERALWLSPPVHIGSEGSCTTWERSSRRVGRAGAELSPV